MIEIHNKDNFFSSAKHSNRFSTLYTSIPHGSLKYALIQEAYKVRDNTFLVIGRNGKVFLVLCTIHQAKPNQGYVNLTCGIPYSSVLSRIFGLGGSCKVH